MNADNYLLNIPTQKIKYGLTRTIDLLNLCGNPQKEIFSIQILGTNGKGSTCAFLNNVFTNAKYRVGLFTSPHLIDYKERIQINNQKITSESIEIFLNKYRAHFARLSPSFFEIMTVLAMWYFKQKRVDIAILETGLGGKLDSVTACNNQILGFTNIDLDHQEILGTSITKIAEQKTQAICDESQKIFSVQQTKSVNKILLNRCKEKKTYYLNNITPVQNHNKYLKGKHQQTNAGLAKAIAEYCSLHSSFHLTQKQINEGLRNAMWPGRFEIINKQPTVIYDVAHNNAGITSFIQTYTKHIKTHKFNTKYLLCGFEANKKINKSLSLLNNIFDKIICTETGIRKSKRSQEILKYFDFSKRTNIQNIKKAFAYLAHHTEENDLICVLGSHYFGPYIYDAINKSFANKE